MVNKMMNWQSLGKWKRPPHVVRVEMGHKQVINCRYPGIVRRRYDPRSIAAVIARPSGINEHRLPSRGDKKRRFASLNIDDVDLKQRRTGGLS